MELKNLGLAMGLAGATACAVEPMPPAPPGSSETLDEILWGDYIELWGDADHAQSSHRFDERSWRREEGGDFASLHELRLIEQRRVSAQLWSALFAYPAQSPFAPLVLRVDFWHVEPETLWLCVHAAATDVELTLDEAPGLASDLHGRGCFGAPWRQLKLLPERRF